VAPRARTPARRGRRGRALRRAGAPAMKIVSSRDLAARPGGPREPCSGARRLPA
jgi:hypothetical protein